MRALFLALYRLLYERVARPLIFRESPQESHARVLRLLAWLDDHPFTHPLLRWANRLAFANHPVSVGGVRLTHPLILAAGFVKGEGFADESEALQAAQERNIIPGWRSLPLLVGAVEFGSFTRCPRLGNPGTVLWRDEPTRSTQNRVGLKNPGALAAAEFLSRHRHELPPVFGISLAVSPGISVPVEACRELLESLDPFVKQAVLPSWFTLNLSCPNTDDDPGSRQTEALAGTLCAPMVQLLQPYNVPLWVKISPNLADEQYHTLLRAFAETGVRAVVATNTLPVVTSGASRSEAMTAGVGGGRLFPHARDVVALLTEEKEKHSYDLDIVASGGVQDGQTYQAFAQHGVQAMQYWSALVYRGPLAAALIERESGL